MKQKILNFIPWVIVIILIGVFVYLANIKTNIPANPNNTPTSTSTDQTQTATTTIDYKNFQYGFVFTLPGSWRGYSIVTDEWQGYSNTDQGQVLAETGPMVSIRHPDWTEAVPRQDIPVMVFTLAQWTKLSNDEFHIGAAPIGPRELGRNSKYVFAIPARYNFAFPAGSEEVDQIINNKALFSTF